MANAWMPGAGRVRSRTQGGGVYQGGAPRAVWLTTESDPFALSARSVAQRLDSDGHSAHLVWNPVTGETAQLLPATVPALGQLETRGTDRAREGRVCIVIRVIGHALSPFTDGPLTGLAPLLDWLDGWQVPRRWPGGAPLAVPPPRAAGTGERAWARGGHFGHSQVPGGHGGGPGAISPERLLGVAVLAPRQHPVPVAAPPPRRDPGANGERPYAQLSGS
ncbi:hypothetical protein ACFO4E_02450 [Nocardiopsis mangrovi]|uniref:Uncharacterized protein n=1 Tax=Nocardiopsis mangrovi TaxID=1179818 RepID=A0ABV9DPL0_9ACTN